MVVLPSIRAILERGLSQIEEGESCQPRMTVEWHAIATKINLNALYSFQMQAHNQFR